MEEFKQDKVSKLFVRHSIVKGVTITEAKDNPFEEASQIVAASSGNKTFRLGQIVSVILGTRSHLIYEDNPQGFVAHIKRPTAKDQGKIIGVLFYNKGLQMIEYLKMKELSFEGEVETEKMELIEEGAIFGRQIIISTLGEEGLIRKILNLPIDDSEENKVSLKEKTGMYNVYKSLGWRNGKRIVKKVLVTLK